jgi:hypothetical protein
MTIAQPPPLPLHRGTKSNIGPIASLASNALAARLWFTVAAVEAVALIVVPYLIVTKMKESERVLLVDEAGTFHLAPLLGFEKASRLHSYHATLATLAFLQRHPGGPDFPDLIDRIYIEPARSEAIRRIQADAGEFASKQIRQKPEITRIEILETRSDEVLVLVHGQLVRVGTFRGRAFQEGLAFRLELSLSRNPRLTDNGRLPLAVYQFRYEENR